MNKPRFRKGKKAFKEYGYRFGNWGTPPLSARQEKFARRYQRALERYEERRRIAMKIALAASAAAVGVMQMEMIIRKPIRNDGNEQQHRDKAFALAICAINSAEAVSKHLS